MYSYTLQAGGQYFPTPVAVLCPLVLTLHALVGTRMCQPRRSSAMFSLPPGPPSTFVRPVNASARAKPCSYMSVLYSAFLRAPHMLMDGIVAQAEGPQDSLCHRSISPTSGVFFGRHFLQNLRQAIQHHKCARAALPRHPRAPKVHALQYWVRG